MKVLSIKQPYAELILQGRKKIELRKWNTKFRGEFLIHAPKKPDEAAMKKFGFRELPCGYVIGKAELIQVKKYSDEKECNRDKQLHLASYMWGSYGFVIENPERIQKIPARGELGFWELNKKN